MSAATICETIGRLTPEERFIAPYYLHHRLQADDETWLLEMQKTRADMDSGRKLTHAQMMECTKRSEKPASDSTCPGNH